MNAPDDSTGTRRDVSLLRELSGMIKRDWNADRTQTSGELFHKAMLDIDELIIRQGGTPGKHGLKKLGLRYKKVIVDATEARDE